MIRSNSYCRLEKAINMKANIKSLIVLIPALLIPLLTGCATTGSDVVSPAHPFDYRFLDDKACADQGIKAMCDDVKEIAALEKTCYTTQTKQCRDEVIGRTRRYIDNFWRQFQSNFFGRLAGIKTASEGWATGVSAFAATTSPPGAASLLSATAASITGLGASMQKNIAGDTAAPILLAQMDADRQRIGASLEIKMRDDYATYGLHQAMADLSEYASTMSVPSALASLSAKTGETKKQATDVQFRLQ